MKSKFALLLTFLLSSVFCLTSFGQDFTALKNRTLTHSSEFKSIEPEILECANYILSTPQDDSNENRQIAIEVLVKWMGGTPDYKFHIDESIGELLQSDPDILSLYLPAMAKYALENPSRAANQNAMKLNTLKLLLNYSENKANRIKQTKELKKLIAVKNSGKLEDYLKV
ncbi:hypothetical protein [Solitalea koreensis]|uniref:HEAT repeat domain-containing protein n=1 Tax=Solitalea koreensis TaxID=543615 RepID=A0A521DDG3_9SPHI|nr:hypothetical protein [Solitalea koreensis]SMO68990.1 hypothetical protein SAMN06265350_106168 [Solitalea koreensis]